MRRKRLQYNTGIVEKKSLLWDEKNWKRNAKEVDMKYINRRKEKKEKEPRKYTKLRKSNKVKKWY